MALMLTKWMEKWESLSRFSTGAAAVEITTNLSQTALYTIASHFQIELKSRTLLIDKMRIQMAVQQ